MTAKGTTVEMTFADPQDVIIKQPSPVAAEIRLWFAVLELAWRDATGREQSAHDRENARAWFASNETGPGSLRWILQMTKLPASVSQFRTRLLWR